jgi:protein SCO1/2
MTSPVRTTSVALLLLVLAVSVGAYLLFRDRGAFQPAAGLPSGGDFTLRSHAGPVSLQDLRGKVVLIHFGYTNCPDVCPVSVAATSQALTAMTPAELNRVMALFISVDPERDTLERLREYTAYFHPNLVGLAGTPEETAAVAKRYGAVYIKRPANPDGSYAVDHSVATYLVAPTGRLQAILPYGATAEDLLGAVRNLLVST